MHIKVVNHKNTTVVELSGEIDMDSSPALRKELMVLIDRRVSPLLIDLKGVVYIDSSGIATFVEGLKAAMAYGGRFIFVGIPDSIMEIFSFSKLDKVFEIYGEIDDALNI